MEQPVFTGKTFDELGDMVERAEKRSEVTITALDLVDLLENAKLEAPVEFSMYGKTLNVAEMWNGGGKVNIALEEL
jgi:hypothetical protein